MTTRFGDYSQLKWFGIVLIFAGLAAIPLGLVLLIFQRVEDPGMTMLGLIVLSNGGIVGGAAILVLESRIGRGSSKQS